MDVQDLASLAVKDGALHSEVIWLSQIGSSGSSAGGNHSRALCRKYLKDMSLPKLFFIEVPVYDSKNRETKLEVDVPLLLLHEWFACLQQYDKFDDFLVRLI